MWFKKGSFPISMWNHFDNEGERTNNRVEGDNLRMKKFCGASKPNIDKKKVKDLLKDGYISNSVYINTALFAIKGSYD